MTARRVILVVVAALLLGAIAGYGWRRMKGRTLEERAHDAAEHMRSAAERITH